MPFDNDHLTVKLVAALMGCKPGAGLADRMNRLSRAGLIKDGDKHGAMVRAVCQSIASECEAQADPRAAEPSDHAATNIFRGFTEGELEAAFERVRDRQDWRAPIDATITRAEKPAVEAAIQFYTASRPTFFRVRGGYRVRAAGYRAGPAGP
jgi:hypothetical protein